MVAHDGLLQHKSVYLNVPFFLQRAALYFAIWLLIMFFLNHWSRQQEQVAGGPQERRVQRRLRLLSAPGPGSSSWQATYRTWLWNLIISKRPFTSIWRNFRRWIRPPEPVLTVVLI